ncbi:reverse transcriptase domain-containing protein [Tanacetum coccineum]
MKQLIAELPMLTAPLEKEKLIVYFAATKETVSAILMTEREAKQMPNYFVSRALRGQEINYTSMEKLVLALVLSRPEVAGRLQKWSIELGEYVIHYRPRVSVKGQILTYFIVERPEEDSPDTLMEAKEELLEPWILFTDESSCTDGSRAGLILTNPEGMEFTYALRFTNVDSRLVANQVNETYVAKEVDMIRYLEKVRTLTSSFKAFSIRQVPRIEKKKAVALSKIASTSFAHLSKQVLIEELNEKSISEVEILAVVEEEGDTRMTPIFEYLIEETLPVDLKKARAVRRKSQRFAVINRILYKKSFLGPCLRCVGPLQANYVLREIHEGSCSMHAGTRSVIAKALRISYYWSTMHKDARTLIRACQECQVHKPVPRNPHKKLSPITSPWPFYKWGIDIAEPFSEGSGKVKFLIVAIDYFTKWIEAKLVTTITGNQIKTFVWDNIVCRFGLPREIISDNGKQLRDNPFRDWCEKLCTANTLLLLNIRKPLACNGETPFSLTYGTKAVIPAELGMLTLRITELDLVQNNEALEINLDLLEEKREQAAIRKAKRKAKIENRAEDTGKLGPKWEGPYEVTESLGKGVYKLRDRDGKQLPRTWNVSNLKRCYIHKM